MSRLLAALLGALLFWSFDRGLTNCDPAHQHVPQFHNLHPAVQDAQERPPTPLWESNFNGVRFEQYNPAEHVKDDKCSLQPGQSRPQRIPKVVHFIFGLAENFGSSPFNFVHYMAVLSAHQRIRPEAIYMHHIFQPTGYWWEHAKHMVTLVKARDASQLYGHKLQHVAHQADILRLEALYKWGGIYMDIDTLSIVPFDALLHHDFIIGEEGDGEYGLGNSVMAAAPGSKFAERWLSAYAAFRTSEWAEHSIFIPRRLAIEHPDELCVLPPYAFSYPLAWTAEGQQALFTPVANQDISGVLVKTPALNGTMYNALYVGQYALHLAEHGSWKYLADYDYQYVREHQTITRMQLLMEDILKDLPPVPRDPDYDRRYEPIPGLPKPSSWTEQGSKLLTEEELKEQVKAADKQQLEEIRPDDLPERVQQLIKILIERLP
ncbi:hypothetical protein WJX72_011726 [[Myrmecia] bisecta]|uniref:Glycosyltransferase n=1 Tax=[Myrmecia] bisecta TaxID=41462 RepID=A0AAW1Q235_9CHLO